VCCRTLKQGNIKNNNMIYCVEPSIYPDAPELHIEEITYQDENDFEWRIARVQNGFFVRYFGHSYFMEPSFICELPSGKEIRLRNTGCLFIQDTSLETFSDMRTVLKNGFTDDIWETLEEMLTERLTHDPRITVAEMTV
jgi:hypothetical protein